MDLNSVPSLDPEMFKKLVASVKPVYVAGVFPEESGERTLTRSDEPVDVQKTLDSSIDLGTVQMAWFSLAPMYCALGDGFNLVKDFHETIAGKGCQSMAFKLDRALYPELGKWSNVIEGMDPAYFEAFRVFLAQTGFTRNDRWWMITEAAFDMRQAQHNGTFKISVFSPVSTDVGIYSYLDVSDGSIKLYRGNGNKLVAQYASIYNSKAKGVTT